MKSIRELKSGRFTDKCWVEVEALLISITNNRGSSPSSTRNTSVSMMTLLPLLTISGVMLETGDNPNRWILETTLTVVRTQK